MEAHSDGPVNDVPSAAAEAEHPIVAGRRVASERMRRGLRAAYLPSLFLLVMLIVGAVVYVTT